MSRNTQSEATRKRKRTRTGDEVVVAVEIPNTPYQQTPTRATLSPSPSTPSPLRTIRNGSSSPPPSPISSFLQNNTESTKTTGVPTKKQYHPVPTDFPRGPDLALTVNQLRQAFYFSPEDRHDIDPEGKIWHRNHGAILRRKWDEHIFERSSEVDPELEGTPYGLPVWVMRSNLGANWIDRAMEFENPMESDPESSLAPDDSFESLLLAPSGSAPTETQKMFRSVPADFPRGHNLELTPDELRKEST
ncbi:hypothetical protein N7532_006391 [Penicillium argentinense]|uniref:Uncharacterized protein n=1 Tax=Penicillium argentinense TaxID=1131581 RepID=A0A9W9KAT7_9EURO|nr:uncharacterized protein N7532_006391 [Penicillium argentinense]KAJ5099390.1 hypothetical protein N7532_006391 [Penicillium argentinense]